LTRSVLAGALAALALVGCGNGRVEDAASAGPAQVHLPQQVLGLRVQPEDISSKLKAIKRPYVDSVAVFSLRDGDLLRASLQVSRFNSAARPEDPDFIGTIVSTVGAAAQQALRVSRETVYATTASDQLVFTWFRGDGMFVLAVQRQYEFPRTLLRRLIDAGVSV
jgi:hypothetical protein